MKKKLQQRVLINLAAFLIIAGLLSCNKPKTQVNNLNADFKKYFDYQAGSYWIFYDSLNHFYDSLSVLGYNDNQVTVNQGIVDEEVTIGMQEYYLDSVTNDTSWELTLTAPYTATLDMDIGLVEMIYGLAYNMPFSIGKTIYNKYTPDIYTQTTLFPSYTIGSIAYNNVYQILYYYNISAYLYTIYLNSDYGFIAVLLNDQNFHKRLFLSRNLLIH